MTEWMQTTAPIGGPVDMQCCCGLPECIFLRHNCSLLDSVEHDVQKAGRLGAALLARHEAYMADAERDRMELTLRIESLETDNEELEAENARTIKENRSLLDQLESLNIAVTDSEDRIKSLEATLLSSQQIIRRLEGETAKSEALERQLVYLEKEQMELQISLDTTKQDARTAVARWKRAERGICDLQEQLERIEKEGREERERHAEMIGRMEKQREVEKMLDTSAGRLKVAAASKSLNLAKDGSNVVSHFVRDLLHDNANLQQGISELREMLMNSNDEIQALREQLMYHQPLEEGDACSIPTLRAELESKVSPTDSPAALSQELHIHHHYHAPAVKQEAKKSKKKRQSLTPGIFIPPAHVSRPTTPSTTPWRPQVKIMQRESLHSKRWSVVSEQPSEFAPSSAPSSPTSNNRHSLFDSNILDSCPGSPTTSIDPTSPIWRPSHRKQNSNVSSRSFQVPTNFSLTPPPIPNHTIIEESDDTGDVPPIIEETKESTVDDDSIPKEADVQHSGDGTYHADTDESEDPRRRLRRTASHESVISLYGGGLDIHTLKSRPSQLTLRHLGNSTSITASSSVTARPILYRDGTMHSSMLLRENYYASSRTPAGILRSVSGPSRSPSMLGKLAGRIWGVGSSAPNTTSLPEGDKTAQKDLGRPPGINQDGAIPGFSEYWAAHQRRTPSKVLPDQVDLEALREGLAE